MLAFEPRPGCLEHLRRNIEINQLRDRIEVHPFGLSDRDETVTVRLNRQNVTFECRRLDALVTEPVSVMKLDVEGMEAKVLGGAAGILERWRPLIFAEAHDEAALAGLLRALAPHGYRPTGRIFNTTATYELAAPSSPMAPPDRLPAVQSLLELGRWAVDDPDLSVEVAPPSIRVESRLAAEKVAHVTWPPTKPTKPPDEVRVRLTPGATYFLQASGQASPGSQLYIYLFEYRGGKRTHVQRHWFSPRLFERIELQPDTEQLRVALRYNGPGVLEVDGLALHSIAPRVTPGG